MARPFLLNVAALINRRSKAVLNISPLLRPGKKRTLGDSGILGSEFSAPSERNSREFTAVNFRPAPRTVIKC